MNKHPIQLPYELIDSWHKTYKAQGHTLEWVFRHVATLAAQWGADQELDKCVEFLGDEYAWKQLRLCTYWKQFSDESEELLRSARRCDYWEQVKDEYEELRFRKKHQQERHFMLAEDPNTAAWVLDLLATAEDPHVRLLVAGNPSTLIETLEILSTDEDPDVHCKAANNPNSHLGIAEY